MSQPPPAPYTWGDRLPRLAGERVELRHLTAADAAAIFAVFGDPEVMQFWSSPPLADLDAARTLIASIDDLFRRRELFQWGVCRRGSDEVIGTCTLYHLEIDHRRGDIGFALGRASWGQGLASDAVATLIGFAFESLGLHRLEADADPDNVRSLRVMERQGFRREGYLRERWYHLGELRDGVFMGLLRHEWTGAGRQPPAAS